MRWSLVVCSLLIFTSVGAAAWHDEEPGPNGPLAPPGSYVAVEPDLWHEAYLRTNNTPTGWFVVNESTPTWLVLGVIEDRGPEGEDYAVEDSDGNPVEVGTTEIAPGNFSFRFLPGYRGEIFYRFILSSEPPADQDDGGSGRDATRDDPVTVAGDITGGLDPLFGDFDDVYRIDVPDGMGVRVEADGLDEDDMYLTLDGACCAGALASRLPDPLLRVGSFGKYGAVDAATHYDIHVEFFPVTPQDDAGSGGDAGAGLPIFVGPGSISGRIAPSEADDTDYYYMDAGDQLATLRLTGSALMQVQTEYRTEGFGVLAEATGFVAIQVIGYDDADYQIAIELGGLPPQDDGGSGRDAGDRFDPVAIGPGTHTGELVQRTGDDEDVYQVEVPDGWDVEIDIDADGPLATDGWVRHGHGNMYGDHGSFENVRSPIELSLWPAVYCQDPGYGWPCEDHQDDIRYRITVTATPPPDLAVLDLRVKEDTIQTDLAGTTVVTGRTIEVDVASIGGPSYGAEFRLAAHWADGRVEELGAQWIWPQPGDAPTTLAYDWDTSWRVGDVTLQASIVPYDRDARPDNNDMALDTFIVVGGAGAVTLG